MSLKSSANVSVNTHELILEISAEDFNKAVLNAYKKVDTFLILFWALLV